MTGVITLAAVLAVPPAPGTTVRFGVALLSEDRTCLAVEGASLAYGTAITLVTPELPQQTFRATVHERLGMCERLQRAFVGGAHYHLSDVDPGFSELSLAVAIIGNVETRRAGGLVELIPGESSESVFVRICTSHEAFHLTAWAGEALAGRRLWHLHWVLDYAVEPTCEAAESEPSSDGASPTNERMQQTKPAVSSDCAGFAADPQC